MSSAVASSAGTMSNNRKTRRRIADQTPQARTAEDTQRQGQLLDVLEIAAVEAIDQGLSAGDLYRLIDKALIRTAFGSFGSSRFKPNQSQIAAQTGLTRPEVRAVLTQLGSDPKECKPIRRSKVAQTYDYLSNRYLKARSRAQPFTVRYEGKGNSFSNAVRAVGGDIPPAAMLKEFSRRGLAIIDRKDSRTRRLVISPRFNLNEKSLRFSLAAGVNKAAQSAGNLQDRGTYLFETVCYTELAVRQFTRLLEQKVPAFFESLGAVRIYADINPNKRSRRTARHLRVALIYWNENITAINSK
jgi:hypothetical protein